MNSAIAAEPRTGEPPPVTRAALDAAHCHAARARVCGGDPMIRRERDPHARHVERWHGAAPSIEERILERAPLTLLRAAVDKLRSDAPDLYAVIQGELEGEPIARIAARLGIALGTAYARARRGREALCAQLRRWASEETRMQVGAARRERERWIRARTARSEEPRA